MAPEKVTPMVLYVDLKCSGCYKKVKKVLCKFPEIRDQIFDVANNKVTITVLCCCPEKIRDKLCYKGGGSIQKIEIVEKPKAPEKPKPSDKPKEADKPKTDKPKESDKPKDSGKSKEAEKPKPKDSDKPKDGEKPKPKAADKPAKDAPKGEPGKPDAVSKAEMAKMMFEPVNGYPQVYPPPYPMVGYGQYHEGFGGGPYQHGYGIPVAPPPPPPPGYSGYGYEYGYSGYRNSYVNHDYFSEENSEGCSIM